MPRIEMTDSEMLDWLESTGGKWVAYTPHDGSWNIVLQSGDLMEPQDSSLRGAIRASFAQHECSVVDNREKSNQP